MFSIFIWPHRVTSCRLSFLALRCNRERRANRSRHDATARIQSQGYIRVWVQPPRDRTQPAASAGSRPMTIIVGPRSSPTGAQAVDYEGKIVFDPRKPDGTPRKLVEVSRLTLSAGGRELRYAGDYHSRIAFSSGGRRSAGNLRSFGRSPSFRPNPTSTRSARRPKQRSVRCAK
jgi:hypothetical protein